MESARVLIEVRGGMVPGQAMDEFSKQWAITSEEWESATSRMQLLLDRYSQASSYALKLSIDSASGMAPNWVELSWVWL